jgi:hypothetical protein
VDQIKTRWCRRGQSVADEDRGGSGEDKLGQMRAGGLKRRKGVAMKAGWTKDGACEDGV